MSPDTMRLVDGTLGPPLCALLSGLRRVGLLGRRWQRGPVTEVRRVLFIKLAEMGATVLLGPTLARARALWPGCETYFLVFAENLGAVALLPDVPPSQVLTIRATGPRVFLADTWHCWRRIRQLAPDVVVDLEFFSRASALLAATAGARATAGFARYTMEGLYKGTLLTHPVQYNPHQHTAVSYLTLIEALAQPAGQTPLAKVPAPRPADLVLPPFVPTEAEDQRVGAILREANATWRPGPPLVILNVNSSQLVPLRRWPLERFIELGRRLLADTDCYVVLTGTRGEAEETAAVAAALGPSRCLELAGKTTLRELLTLYRRCRLMVTNDSGPAHFAGLTPMPTIVLFGPETPEVFGPLAANKVALTSGLACSPCVSVYNHRKSPCTDNVCMRAIGVDRVYAECRRLLAAYPAPGDTLADGSGSESGEVNG